MIYLIAGISVIFFAAADIGYTVLSSNGAGYFSKYAMRYIAAVFQFAARRTGSRSILKYAGVSVLSVITIIWILLLWLGVFLIFLYDQNSVLDSATLVPAGAIDRFYFSGYLLSTLGNGDFKPQNGIWQIAATVFSFSGFIFLTTGITYFVSILSAVTEKRLAAISVFNLGKSAAEISAAIKKLHRAGQLMSEVSSLKNHLNRLTLNHTSYPISHYFFALEKNRSISLAAAELDQALEDLRTDEQRDENLSAQLDSLRESLDSYLQTLAERFLSHLLKGKAVVNEETVKEAEVRKQIIKALLYGDVWVEELPEK